MLTQMHGRGASTSWRRYTKVVVGPVPCLGYTLSVTFVHPVACIAHLYSGRGAAFIRVDNNGGVGRPGKLSVVAYFVLTPQMYDGEDSLDAYSDSGGEAGDIADEASSASDNVQYENDDCDDDDFELMSDDGVFADEAIGVADKRRKPYQVEFACLSPGGIEGAQHKEIEHVASMFMVSDAEAAVLLRHYHWNKERLIEKYMDSPEQVKNEAGVLGTGAVTEFATLTDFMCAVCCMSADDYGGSIDTCALPCGHRYCRACYERYTEQKVMEDGESRRVLCMSDECRVVVDESTMQQLLKQNALARYRALLDRTYIDDNKNLRGCPAPDCQNTIECQVTPKQLATIVPSVHCDCGHWFCFGCGHVAHQPVICAVVKLWLKKCEDDSETANWISANTKECPKCSSTIEKNGGCNHMKCRSCKYEFCWICSGPWEEHGNSWYNCNRYDEKSGSEARDTQAKSRASLDRYLHYFNRFANHEQSARLDHNLYLRIEKKMDEMQLTSDLTWIEVQFLRKAADTLTECRMTLKWTYCMAYYLQRDNMTVLFEDNQSDLERAVEELSGQLETPIDKQTIPAMRQKVTDCKY